MATSAIVFVGMAGVIFGGGIEFGAYVLPVAVPLVWLVRLAFSVRLAVAGALAALSLVVFSLFAPVGSRADVEAAARPLRTIPDRHFVARPAGADGIAGAELTIR